MIIKNKMTKLWNWLTQIRFVGFELPKAEPSVADLLEERLKTQILETKLAAVGGKLFRYYKAMAHTGGDVNIPEFLLDKQIAEIVKTDLNKMVETGQLDRFYGYIKEAV